MTSPALTPRSERVPFNRAVLVKAADGSAELKLQGANLSKSGIFVKGAETLEPGTAPSRSLSWLREQDGSVIAIVGHEPDLGTLVTWLLTGATESHVPLGKGAACLLDLGETPGKAKATLEWAITASQLRRLAD